MSEGNDWRTFRAFSALGLGAKEEALACLRLDCGFDLDVLDAVRRFLRLRLEDGRLEEGVEEEERLSRPRFLPFAVGCGAAVDFPLALGLALGLGWGLDLDLALGLPIVAPFLADAGFEGAVCLRNGVGKDGLGTA